MNDQDTRCREAFLRTQIQMYLDSAEWERGRGNIAGARIAEMMADRRIRQLEGK